MKWRLAYLAAVALVLAAITHILIVLLVPRFGTRDAWAYLSGRTDLFSFTMIDTSQRSGAIAQTDPFFAYGVCRFDLSAGGLRMQAPATSSFWSASVFDANGAVVYSLNNRTAIDNTLDLLILDPLQTLELRQSQPEEIESSVVIEANVRLGFVIIRVHRPDETWGSRLDEFMKSIRCSRYQL